MLVEINLLPDELRKRTRSEKGRLNLQVPRFVPYVVIISVALAVATSFAVIAYTGSVTSSLESAKRTLKEESTHAAKTIAIQADMPELKERSNAIVGRVADKVYWWEILDQIARSCPPNAILETFKVMQDPATKQPQSLTVSGYYMEDSGLEITFTRNLQASAKLGRWIDKVYPGETNTVEDRRYFTVKCVFRKVEQEEIGEVEE